MKKFLELMDHCHTEFRAVFGCRQSRVTRATYRNRRAIVYYYFH